MRIHRQPPLSVALQYSALRSNPICAGVGRLVRGQLSWQYEVQPTLLSRAYTIQISYRIGGAPQVMVKKPDLVELARPRRIPHVYQQDPTILCLHLPSQREWTPRLRLDQYIVPWTAVWLFFFEEWLESDHWKGGGKHPGDADKPEQILDVSEG
jgi:hypothetical protein